MAKSGKFCFALLLVFLALTTTASVKSPVESSPTWAPQPAAESPLTEAPASSPTESLMSSHPPLDISPNPSPAESPLTDAPASSTSESPMSSPPSHSPSDISPNPSPAQSPSDPLPDSSPSPSPITNKASDITTGDNAEGTGGSKGGMSGGKKAGIAVGVIVGAILIGVGVMTYKKRRDNISRTEYRYEARKEIL